MRFREIVEGNYRFRPTTPENKPG